MRHTKYVQADEVNNNDTYQWGQYRTYFHNGQKIVHRLAGYVKGKKGGSATAVWLDLATWTRRYYERPKIMKQIKRDIIVKPVIMPMDRTIKTKGKRYTTSFAPHGYYSIQPFARL